MSDEPCPCELVNLKLEQVREGCEFQAVWRCQACGSEFYPARYTRKDFDKLYEAQDLINEILADRIAALERENAELRQRVES